MVKSNCQCALAGFSRPCLFCSRPTAHQLRELWLRRFRNCLVRLGLLLCYHVRPRPCVGLTVPRSSASGSAPPDSRSAYKP
nr:putative integron gene cassette protein [uncultured bacterium]